MELRASRGGGIANLQEDLGPVDTQSFDDDIERRIGDLVHTVGFFGLPAEFPRTGNQSDAMWYSLSVSTTDESRSVSWDDNHEAPSELHEIVRAIEEAGATWHPAPIDNNSRS
jgi:hypothetical protein